jgi:biotin transporter BioY
MGFAAFGIVLALFSFGSALGAFSLNFRGYDLSGFLTVLAGSLSGFLLGWGVTILLPNSLTDRFLDQKHVWKLAAIVALVLTVATLVLR